MNTYIEPKISLNPFVAEMILRGCQLGKIECDEYLDRFVETLPCSLEHDARHTSKDRSRRYFKEYIRELGFRESIRQNWINIPEEEKLFAHTVKALSESWYSGRFPKRTSTESIDWDKISLFLIESRNLFRSNIRNFALTSYLIAERENSEVCEPLVELLFDMLFVMHSLATSLIRSRWYADTYIKDMLRHEPAKSI